MDHDAGAEEEERLEERVGQQQVHALAVGADAHRREHVADLAHGGVGDDPLDVGLHHRDHARHQERREAEDRHHVVHGGRVFEDHVRARDEVDAGRHHRRGVDERRDRGGAFHRVGKPCLERELRRLRDGAHQQAERDQVGVGRAVRPRLMGREHHGEVGGAGVAHHEEHGDRDADVADGVHHERLLGCLHRLGALVPEPDQQVGREPHQAPAGEEQREVGRHHQQQHREQEHVQVGEEPAFLGVAVQVADRVEHDQGADAGDDQHLGHRQLIDLDRQRDLEAAARWPRCRACRSMSGRMRCGPASARTRRRPPRTRWPRTPCPPRPPWCARCACWPAQAGRLLRAA